MTVRKAFATTAYAVADAMRVLGAARVADLLSSRDHAVSANMLYKGTNANTPNGLGFLTWDGVQAVMAELLAQGQPEYFGAALEREAADAAEALLPGSNRSVQRQALELAATIGAVQQSIVEATDPDGDGGEEITPAEAERSHAAIAEAQRQLDDLRATMARQAAAYDAAVRTKGGRR